MIDKHLEDLPLVEERHRLNAWRYIRVSRETENLCSEEGGAIAGLLRR
jgi:hypothetical protein